MGVIEAVVGLIGAILTTVVPLVANSISKLNARIRALESAADKQSVINNQIISDIKDLEQKVEKLQTSMGEIDNKITRVLAILESSKEGK